ncbi:hypothetical protein C0989_007195 [Termitomyces sp. Mn162]|nr:hypothetical protein C0989_007195 [Termitomyces sp. Mn162]
MSLEYWKSLQMESNDEGNALAKQPQCGSRPIDVSLRYAPYPTYARRVKVFKNIATVPDITLNYAQTEGVTPLGAKSTLFPLFSDLASSPTCTDMHCYTPPLSSTPTSVNSDLSPITTSEQISDPFLSFSHSLSPLLSNSLRLSDNSWNVSPISATIDLPSLELFADSPNEPKLDNNLHESSPVLTAGIATGTKYDIVVPLDEHKPSVKRRRCTFSELELESPSSLPTHHRGISATKKALEHKKAITTRKTRNKGPNRSHASDSSKYMLGSSSKTWLKLSPLSITERTSPCTSYSLPPPSLSPSATPELSNVRKRKRAMTSPLVTPLQSPLPVRLISVDCNVEAPSPSSSASNGSDEEIEREDADIADDDDYVYQDFITARAMAQRRSERTKAPISYADCDEDIPEKQAKGRATKARAKPDDFKTQAPRNLRKKSCRRGPKRQQKVNPKCECPFGIICPIPFGRFSDVVRHLESNVLHTHAEKDRWECPDCGSRLARSDSYKRHVNARACGKRAPTEKVKPVYSPEVERELERIRNSDHPAILAAKERL